MGIVAAGLLVKGVVQENSDFLVGPDRHGQFFPVEVDSVHRNKTQCRVVEAGQAASLALAGPSLRRNDLRLRKGMVIVGKKVQPVASMVFEAKVIYRLYVEEV